MTINTLKITSLLPSLLLLTACNDYLMTNTTTNESTWRLLLSVASSCLLLIPILSLVLLVFSQWKHIQFKIVLQRYLHGSLLLMLALAWFIELNLVQRSDSPIDLMLTLCALTVQMALVVFAFIRVNKQQKMLYRANNFL